MSYSDLLDSKAKPWLSIYPGTVNDSKTQFMTSVPYYVDAIPGGVLPPGGISLVCWVWPGLDRVGAPKLIETYVDAAGLGNRQVLIRSLDLATTYYATPVITGGPAGMYTMTKITDLPSTATSVQLWFTCDNTGNTVVGGTNIYY